MIIKVKSGTITKIPHLTGKTQEEADSFFNKLVGNEEYNMRLIGENWYLERPMIDKKDVDDSHNTAVTGYTLNDFKQYAGILINMLESIEPEYYKNLDGWCNPQAYFFIGDWKDVKNAYACLITLNSVEDN